MPWRAARRRRRESHRRGGDARGNGGDTTFHRRSAGKQRMVCTHRFPFSMLEVQVSPAPVATVPRLLLRNGRGTAFPSSTRPTDKSGLGRTGTLSAHHPVRHGGQSARRGCRTPRRPDDGAPDGCADAPVGRMTRRQRSSCWSIFKNMRAPLSGLGVADVHAGILAVWAAHSARLLSTTPRFSRPVPMPY